MRLTILFQFIFAFTACFANNDVCEVMSNNLSVNSPQTKEKTKWTYRTMPDGFKWLPFEDEDGYLGVKDKNGKIIVPSFYTNINYNEGFFLAKDRHSIYSIYLNTGELFLPANDIVDVIFDETISNSPFVLLSERMTWMAIDRKGKILVPEDKYDFLYITKTDNKNNPGPKEDWGFKIGKNSFHAFADKTGKLIIPFNKYNGIARNWDSEYGIHYNFYIYGDHKQSGICDSKGNEMVRSECSSTYIGKNEEGKSCIMGVWKGNDVELDKNGKPKILPETAYNLFYDMELDGQKYDYMLAPDGRYGIRKEDKNIIPAIFDVISPGKKHFIVRKGSYMGAYNNKGECIITPNKYQTIGEMDNYFSVKLNGLRTCVDFSGKELLPLKYNSASLHIVNKDSFFIVTDRESYKRAIFHGTKQLTPFIYRDAGFMTDKVTGNCIGLYVFDNSKRIGLCTVDGKEIIEPLFTDINKIDSEKQIFYKVVSGKKTGLYDAGGRMIIQPELFDNISISGKKIIATGDDRICEFNFKGKLLSDSHPNAERDQFIKMADAEFEKANWDKAAKFYDKAIEYRASATLYYNKAVSYYNDKSYNKAVKEFNNCLASNPSQNLKDKSRALIAKARQLQAEKIERRNARISNILGLVVGVAATAATVYTQTQVASQQNKSNGYNSTTTKRNTDLDYLLDPNYAMQQVQMQNWRDYMAETDGGKTMSYDEWFALKAQAMAGSRDSDSGGSSSNSSSSSSSTTTKKVYASDCRLCYGTGQCRTCEGRGYYYNPLDLSKTVACPNCHNHNGQCSSCGGTGKKL